jgi:hypothetical protein
VSQQLTPPPTPRQSADHTFQSGCCYFCARAGRLICDVAGETRAGLASLACAVEWRSYSRSPLVPTMAPTPSPASISVGWMDGARGMRTALAEIAEAAATAHADYSAAVAANKQMWS